MNVAERYDETITLPRAVRFPVEFLPPPLFDAERPETWPKIAGRFECVKGKLLYMPPCGDLQQDSVTDVVIALGKWVREHPDHVLGTNEAGMRLAGDTRAADAAIWRRSDLGSYTGKLRRVPPVLAVEVGGEDENEQSLRDKAKWYLKAAVEVVWVVLPEARVVLVFTKSGEKRFGKRDVLPRHKILPDLQVHVDELFRQISSK